MPSKITTIKRVRVMGDFMMFGIFICLLIIFLHAYINGWQNGNYQTIVDINSRNEAHVELIILLFILGPLFRLTTLWSFLDWKSTWRARDHIRFEQYYFESEPQKPKKKPEETILMRCSGCGEMFGVTNVSEEMRIECPHCKKSGVVKIPAGRGKPPRTIPVSEGIVDDQDDDQADSPRVRIIKNI